MTPYLSHKAFMLSRYGEALFSIPVNLEFGCPNRDQDGGGGCTFCPEHGSRAAQIADAKTVEEQIQKALSFAKRRYKASSFALYIQAYTATFASLVRQKEAYEKLLSLYPFRALHVGTRPDCLSEATLAYLSELNHTIDVVVELGVQSLHDVSLEQMNRGHDAACSLEAIRRLRTRGLKVYAHLIIGLPNETPAMWEESVRSVVNAGVDGIKFHNLHVIQNTALAHEYEAKPFHVLGEYEYAEALIGLLRYVPSHIPIVRLATDTPNHELVAPKWHMTKGQFGEYVAQSMHYRGIVQGDLTISPSRSHSLDTVESRWEPQNALLFYPIGSKCLVQASGKVSHVLLDDGSTTLWNKVYRDYYHPKSGAYMQAKRLFLEGSHLQERLEKGDVKLLDIGFGMGYNTLESLKLAQKVAKHTLHVKAIDHDRMLLKQSMHVVPESLHVKMLETLFACKAYEDEVVKVELLSAEARYVVQGLEERFDVIFLDPFVESRNASLVSLEFLTILKTLLKPSGVLVASTSFQAVHDALILAGFDVEIVHRRGSDIKGVIAQPLEVSAPLHVSHPYTDPHLVWNDKMIESEHQKGSLV